MDLCSLIIFAKVMASAGVEAAVQLDKEVNLVPNTFSHHPYAVRCVSLSLDMSFEVDLVVILNEKGLTCPKAVHPKSIFSLHSASAPSTVFS